MDGWIDGWMDGWMDILERVTQLREWMDRHPGRVTQLKGWQSWLAEEYIGLIYRLAQTM